YDRQEFRRRLEGPLSEPRRLDDRPNRTAFFAVSLESAESFTVRCGVRNVSGHKKLSGDARGGGWFRGTPESSRFRGDARYNHYVGGRVPAAGRCRTSPVQIGPSW